MTAIPQTARPRRAHLHPKSIAGLAARHVSSPLKQSPQFKVRVPAEDDFIIRFNDGCNRGVEVSVLRASAGKLTVFADRLVEVELIGTNADRAAQSASKKAGAISVSAIRKVIRKRRSALAASL